MNRSLMFLSVLSLGCASAAPQAVTLRAADGVTVFAQHAMTARAGGPLGVTLLFHQADSNLHEFGPVVPQLARAGFASLAVDARIGGEMFGAVNRTAAAATSTPDAGYGAALPDLEAAVAWARARYPGVPLFALGSSYSAALVFVLAERHPDLAGILAFSPADYTGDGRAGRAARASRVPVFATTRGDVAEEQRMEAVLRGSAAPVTRFRPDGGGVHGASSLREDRNILGTAGAYWQATLAFLRRWSAR